ncbi:hypothetical protein [Phenylobacterium immobile]|uniref:hypothetical protein n=1 Tax=Phenylobacterium immobile TaxID=21 RepID=UPI000B80FB66|nr:hypothetical protein [Phenylobacterium immobile]
MTERLVIRRIAEVAAGVASQAGVPGADVAGLIVSFLAANPEHVSRFMAEGGELFIDGTIRAEHGALSFGAMNGKMVTPAESRALKGMPDQ